MLMWHSVHTKSTVFSDLTYRTMWEIILCQLIQDCPGMAVDFPLHAVFLIDFRKNRRDWRYRYSYHKELGHVVKKAGKSKICKAGVLVWVWRLGAADKGWELLEESMSQFKGSQASENSLLLKRRSAFSIVYAFNCWMRPTHSVEDNGFPQPTNFNVDLTQKIFFQKHQSNIWLTSRAPYGPLKLTHKIDQNTCQLRFVEGHCLECCGEDVKTWAGIIYWCLSGPWGEVGRWMKGFHLRYTFVIQSHIKEGIRMGAFEKVIAYRSKILSKKFWKFKKLYMKLSIMSP